MNLITTLGWKNSQLACEIWKSSHSHINYIVLPAAPQAENCYCRSFSINEMKFEMQNCMRRVIVCAFSLALNVAFREICRSSGEAGKQWITKTRLRIHFDFSSIFSHDYSMGFFIVFASLKARWKFIDHDLWGKQFVFWRTNSNNQHRFHTALKYH